MVPGKNTTPNFKRAIKTLKTVDWLKLQPRHKYLLIWPIPRVCCRLRFQWCIHLLGCCDLWHVHRSLEMSCFLNLLGNPVFYLLSPGRPSSHVHPIRLLDELLGRRAGEFLLQPQYAGNAWRWAVGFPCMLVVMRKPGAWSLTCSQVGYVQSHQLSGPQKCYHWCDLLPTNVVACLRQMNNPFTLALYHRVC